MIYAVTLNDGSLGTITITDEPLPGVVGWLAFAGLAALTGLAVYGMETCDRLSISVSGDIAETKGETTIVCEKG